MDSDNNLNKDAKIRQILTTKYHNAILSTNQFQWNEIEELNISPLTEHEVKIIKNNLTSLKKLEFSDRKRMKVSQQAINELSLIPSLVHFKLSFQFTFLKIVLPKFESLKRLELNAYHNTPKNLLCLLKNVPQLQFFGALCVFGKQIVDCLQTSICLKGVQVSPLFAPFDGNYPDNIFYLVRQLPQLTCLKLTKAILSNEDLRTIVNINPNLMQLDLPTNKLTSYGMNHLIPLKHLSRLNIKGNLDIDAGGISTIAKNLRSLKELIISQIKFSRDIFEKISSNLKSLEILRIEEGFSHLEPDFWNQFLSKVPSLRELSLFCRYNSRLGYVMHNNLKLLESLELKVRVFLQQRLLDTTYFYLSKSKSLKKYVLPDIAIPNAGANKLLRNVACGNFHLKFNQQVSKKISKNARVLQFTRHSLVKH